MTRAYIRLDPQFDERKESYPDGPYRALIAVLCQAESQPIRGRFRSLDYLKRVLGKAGRHVSYLVSHGDIIELPDGRAYVQGWDEWQEGDWKVGERVRRIRNRRNGLGNGVGNGLSNGDVTSLRNSGGGGSGGAEAVTAERASAMTDEEARRALDALHAQMKANGLIPSERDGPMSATMTGTHSRDTADDR